MNALKSELTRILSLRSSLIYSILFTGAFYGPIVLIVMFFSGEVDTEGIGIDTLLFGSAFFIPIAIIYGAAATASEIRHGSSSLNFLVQRNRWSSYFARIAANLIFISVNYFVGLGLAFAVANFHPHGLTLDDKWALLIVVNWAVALLWTTVGVAFGFIFRNVAMAVAVPLLWITVAESILLSLPIESVAKFATWLPYYISNGPLPASILGSETPHSIPEMVAVLVGVLAVFVAGGFVLNSRRDVLA